MTKNRGYKKHVPRLVRGDIGWRPNGKYPDYCMDRSPVGRLNYLEDWVCTRPKNHVGRHAAHRGSEQLASWNAK